jgi:hypothetical protein
MRQPLRLLVGADAVDFPAQHQLLRGGAVSGEEDILVALVDEHADLAGRVAGERDERDVAGFGQAQALRERPERIRLELDDGWPEPRRPALVRDVAAQASAQPRSVLELRPRDEDLVEVEVGTQVAALHAAPKHLAQRRPPAGQEPVPHGARQLRLPGHGADQVRHQPARQSAPVELDRLADQHKQIRPRRARIWDSDLLAHERGDRHRDQLILRLPRAREHPRAARRPG